MSPENRLTMQDPRAQHHDPPFPAQLQSAPGLAARMGPRPNHGDTNCVGLAKPRETRALIIGADSGIGRGALANGISRALHDPPARRIIIQGFERIRGT